MCISRFYTPQKLQHPNDIILKVHDVVIKDKTEIANVFNDYFVSNARDFNEIKGNYAEDHFCQGTHPSIITIHKNNTKQRDQDCFSFQLTKTKYKLSSYY